MNELQEQILRVVLSILKTERLYEPFVGNSPWVGQRPIDHGSIRYGILNYIAKISLARDRYFITPFCHEYLTSKGLLTKRGLRRGLKGSRHKFTYEHPVPVNQLADWIISNRDDEDRIRNMLVKTDLVTVLTYEENEKLNTAGLSSTMPADWNFNSGRFFARYVDSGIEIPISEIEVYGAIAR